MPRPSNDHQRAALISSMRHALRRAGGGACFSHVSRVAEGTLSKYASGDWPDVHVPVDVALDLDIYTGEPVMARALAAAQGFDLVKKDDTAERPANATPLSALGALAREHADLIGAIVAASADGTLSEAERRTIRREAHELQSEVHRLLAALDGDVS